MNIIIAGDGEVGFYLAKMLTDENHNITVVDPHQELLKMVESHSDLLTLAGDSTSISVLQNANVKNADLLISVVHDEKINILTAILGKKLGAKRTIARVNNSEYLSEEMKEMFHSMGIDAVVSPEYIAAKEIIRLLNQTAATEVFDFSNGRLSLLLLKLDEKAQILNMTLNEIATKYKDLNYRAVAIHHKGKTIIPRGDDKFQIHDLTYVISKPEGIDQLLEIGGKERIEIKNIMIVGGGRIGKITAIRLQDDFSIKLLEKDKERCNLLVDLLENTMVINGDARSIELLEEEGIANVNAFVAVTRDSETNILTCMMARTLGVPRTIALVENIDYIDIAQNMGIDSIINKKLIAASYIARFTMASEVSATKCLNGIDAEVMEFVVKKGSPVTKQPLYKLNFPKDAIIGGIVRGYDSFIAIGNFQVQEDDRVVVFCLPSAIQKVDKFFR